MKGEKGFTLVELLVVIAIIGVLAAVAVPNISRFLGADELKTVQQAVNQMMNEEGLDSLNNPVTQGKATNDMTIYPSPQHPLYPKYLGDNQTKHRYWVEIEVKVEAEVHQVE